MSQTKKYTEFDLVSQELEGNNIIEASAGTGKTFSIAVLVVRLIIEKNIPIEKILLVTFTEAAAAELKERTVRFIRLALKEIDQEGSTKNEAIRDVIKKPTQISDDEKKERLNKALLDIDKATMSTIHSFCQETLNEFAFETGQVFGKELMTDISEIVEQELNEYWRTEIVPGNKMFFDAIGIGKKEIWKKAVENAMNGQKLVGPMFETYEETNVKSSYKLIEEFDGRLLEFRERIITFPSNLTPTKEQYLKSGQEFYNYLKGSPKHRFEEIFPDEIQRIRAIPEAEMQVAHFHLNEAISEVLPKVKTRLAEKNVFTFDDLIQSLYKSRNETILKDLMRDKYKAVFVDEFQDTDPYQYGVFKSFFQDCDESILFYIGDPKQSIYGWRKADLETYLSARGSENMKVLRMNKNHRSSERFVTAANAFFKLDKKTNLEYKPVEAVNNTNPGLAWINKSKGSFPSIYIRNKHDGRGENEINESLKEILLLLFSGELDLNGKMVQPSDVAILVRTGKNGKKVKRLMNDLKIPSVVLAEDSVFSSVEAEEIKLLLNAVLNITPNNTNVLLLTDLMRISADKLHEANVDDILPFLYELKGVWENEGVFVMINKFMSEFNLINTWSKASVIGQQKLANIQQLIDILQSQSLQSSLTPSEQLLFLSHQIKEKPTNGEFEQGIESDEDAVKIMTIHKSKGLEFNIVLLPYLSLSSTEQYTFSNFRKKDEDSEQNIYYFSLKGLTGDDAESFKKQLHDENERLLYVAVTRAKYNAFVLAQNGENILKPYVAHQEKKSSDIITVENFSKRVDWSSLEVRDLYQNGTAIQSLKPFPAVKFPDANYHKMSYSFLGGTAGKTAKLNTIDHEEGSYDHFIFKDLAKGAHIGNLLHDVFEFIDFTDNATWKEQIERSVQRFLPSKSKDEVFRENLYEMVEHTVNASIEIGGENLSLSDIPRAKRINELEFNFPIREEFLQESLENILTPDDERTISTNYGEVRGMMTGFVDLFFEHNGKYYILDWKSNFLGDDLAHYDRDGVLKGMNEGNYHLQYLLYTVAVEKFLKSRLGADFDFEKHFGGVIYVFLRGARAEEKTGFFVQDVTKEELDKMKEVLFKEAVNVQ